MLLADCEVLDAKIAAKKAETNDATTGDAVFDQYVTELREARKHYQLASQHLQEAQQNAVYATYLITVGGLNHTPEAPNPLVVLHLQRAQELQNMAKKEVLITNL